MALDSRYRPLQPERTCQHLEVGASGAPGRYYGRCAVGTPADRARWAGPDRELQLAEAEALTLVIEERMGGLTEQLWAAKALQLQAFDHGGDATKPELATAALEQVASAYMVDIEALLRDERARLDRLNLPVDTCMELFTELFARWIPQRTGERPAIPDEVVERFPEQAWWLLRPRTPVR